MENQLDDIEPENKNLKTQIEHLKQMINDTIEKDAEQVCCCETVTNVKCPDCDCFICENCWIHKVDYAAQIDVFLCDECYRNRDPTIRGKCISCEYIDNLEEGTECNHCGHWVCASCAIYKDDGNYYCNENYN
jgi:hypothetical protein